MLSKWTIKYLFFFNMVHWSFILNQGWLLSNNFCKACQNCICSSFEIVQFDELSDSYVCLKTLTNQKIKLNKCMQSALWIMTKEFKENKNKYSRLTFYEDSLYFFISHVLPHASPLATHTARRISTFHRTRSPPPLFLARQPQPDWFGNKDQPHCEAESWTLNFFKYLKRNISHGVRSGDLGANQCHNEEQWYFLQRALKVGLAPLWCVDPHRELTKASWKRPSLSRYLSPFRFPSKEKGPSMFPSPQSPIHRLTFPYSQIFAS